MDEERIKPKYERTISLRTIYQTLIRRTEVILGIFVVGAAASFIVTNFILPKEYTSTATMAYNAAIPQATYSTMQNTIKSDATMQNVVDNLAKAKVTHANGSAITKSEVSSGLSFSAFASNMVQYTISYKAKDGTIPQYVLSEVMSVAYDTLKPSYAGLTIYADATAATKTSKENTYLLIGVAASLVVALGIPFIYEIATDTVYTKNDIEDWGAPAFEMRASGK